MQTGVHCVVREVEFRTRPVHLRLPFRFGAATLTECPQLFARVTIEVPGHDPARGYGAELMVPKWFDKRPSRSTDDNIADLARAARQAAAAYCDGSVDSAFEHCTRHYPTLLAQGRAAGLSDLSIAFGQAILDKAILDALCATLGISVFEAMHRNVPGLRDTPLAPDLAGWDWPDWLATLRPLRRIDVRHTVGLLDALDTVPADREGEPVSLRAAIARHGLRCFKIKLGGDPAADLARLRAVLAVLDDAVGDYRYSVDGNEQYVDPGALGELLAGLGTLRPPLYIEQPVPRDASLDRPVPPAPPAPFLMDEADATLDAWPRGHALGWRGVSSKSCKGLYKSILNRARCDRWNRADDATPPCFMSAEDLTCQAGLAVQQDLALAALLGITHAERNGHHYGPGFGTAPPAEQAAFAAAHPDLYEWHEGRARLRIADGAVDIASLLAPGSYARGALPDWAATDPLPPTEIS